MISLACHEIKAFQAYIQEVQHCDLAINAILLDLNLIPFPIAFNFGDLSPSNFQSFIFILPKLFDPLYHPLDGLDDQPLPNIGNAVYYLHQLSLLLKDERDHVYKLDPGHDHF